MAAKKRGFEEVEEEEQERGEVKSVDNDNSHDYEDGNDNDDAGDDDDDERGKEVMLWDNFGQILCNSPKTIVVCVHQVAFVWYYGSFTNHSYYG